MLWAIIDKIVDDYAPVVEGLERDIEEVEQTVFSGTVAPTQRIYLLRREVTDFFRAVHPLLGPAAAITGGGVLEISAGLRQYFRDVDDHLKLVNEEIIAQRDLLTTILQANLAVVSAEQNEVVRKISAWAAIITVPTFVASFYRHELRRHARAPLALHAIRWSWGSCSRSPSGSTSCSEAPGGFDQVADAGPDVDPVVLEVVDVHGVERRLGGR